MKIQTAITVVVLLAVAVAGCQQAAEPKGDEKGTGADDGGTAVTENGDTANANETGSSGADDAAAGDEGKGSGEGKENGAQDEEKFVVETEAWGTADGKDVNLYTLKNKNGMICKVTNWGATITELHVKDRNGDLADVVLGYGTLAKWLDSDGEGNANPSYFGCTVGRSCNRIANGKFELDGKTYELAQNNDPSHLHGGKKGWDKAVWVGEVIQRAEGPAVRFTHKSPDGDENYPGNVSAEVVYVLTADDELRVELTAQSDKPTPVNMTNHSYFNLAGEGNGTILDHELKLETERYTVFGDNDIPTGEIASVEETPFDFREATRIGERIDQLTGDPGGYDQNYALRDAKIEEPELAATVYDPSSGRQMQISTTEVGIQFYTGNYLDGSLVGKSGKGYEKHFGLCLEPQFHPDSPNKPEFPSSILQPGDKYSQVSVYKFSVRDK